MGGVLVTGARLPWWRRRRVARALPPPPALHGRYRWAYDTRGPKVRLGLLWFAAAVAAARLGAVALAVLYGSVGAVAAVQASLSWRRGRSAQPHRLAAATIAGGMAVAGLGGPVVILGAVAVAALLAVGVPGPAPTGSTEGTGAFARATLRCGLPVGLAVAAPALVHGVGPEVALLLVLLVSTYEAGDFLIGSGAANLLEGPLAGAIGVLAMTFPASLVEPQPLSSRLTWALGGLTALCCPLGQLVASAILPRGNVFAPALRRVDSLVVTGPMWVMVLVATHGLW